MQHTVPPTRKLKKTSVLRVKQFYFRVVTRHVHVSTLRVTQVKMVLQLEFLNIIHSAKSVLCDTVYYNVYSNLSSNISCLRIEHYKQMRILKYCQSRAVSGILANL